MAEKKTEMKICKECGIVVTDVRTGSTALFMIGDLEPCYKGTAPQLVGSDERGLGYRISVEYHEERTEIQEKAEKFEAVRAWGEKYFSTFRQFAPIAELEEILKEAS